MSTETKNYLAMNPSEELMPDLEHSGVKGMKWGVRRNSSELRSAAAKRAESKPATKPEANAASAGGSSGSSSKPVGNIQDNVESSSDRYTRLAASAKAGKGNSMSDTDLKFFNARTDALAKVAKLEAKPDPWLRDTAAKVLKSTAERQLQAVSDAAADKYISGPLLGKIKSINKTGDAVEPEEDD